MRNPISSTKVFYPLLFVTILFSGAGLWIYFWLFSGLPSVDNLASHEIHPSIRITDRNGRILYETIGQGEGRNIKVPLDSIPQSLRQATISTEDSSFYENPGVDIKGIVRSIWINLRGGEALAGGSTITQQLARNLLMEPGERSERSLRRKLRESWLAWQISRRYSKDQILALYLNQMYYGEFSYGVEAASQTYFGKPVSDLDLAQCALLAGLTQAPGLYSPLANPEAAKQRQLDVLELMQKHGVINSQEASLAAKEPLIYTSDPFPIEAPHFVMMVESQLDQLIPAEVLRGSGGLLVKTTLDLDWQHHAEAIAKRQLEILNQPANGQAGHNVHNAALVALDPVSGEILALLGSPDYFDASISGAVNMAIMPAQPGSALKPIIYAAALDPQRPQPWTAAQMILDVRTAFTTHGGQPYVPENYDRKEHGPVTARQALASSLNIPAVIALNSVGLKDTIHLAGELGISTFEDPDEYDLSLALGGGAVKLLELTAAYAAFDNGGYRVFPSSILEITDSNGEVLYRPEKKPQPRVLDERVAWLITNILSDDGARAIGFGLNSALKLDRPAAAKTGTTTNFHDNWTVGYTPDLVVGVWAGNADYQPMHDVTGLTGAGPIWHQFMRTVLTGRPELQFKRPDGLSQVEVCALSGKLPSADCPYQTLEWFIQGTEPKQTDTLYRRVEIDTQTGKLAESSTPPGRRVEKLVLDLPPEAGPWARSQGLTLLSDVSSGPADGNSLSHPSAPIRLISPDPNAVFHLDPGLPQDQQKLKLEAVGEAGLKQVTVWVDGIQVADLHSSPYTAWWALTLGPHQAWVEAVRANGERVTSEIISFSVR